MTGPRVTILSGGVGGAKLADGLYRELPADTLTVIGNTGDDLVRHGLHICPDLDIVTYTLAGIVDAEKGWGIQSETWRALDALRALGEETWFRLGDRDLATHIIRTARLHAGESLTAITQSIAGRLGVRATILPPSNDRVETHVETPRGWMSFEEFFVREACAPDVLSVAYSGGSHAEATVEVLDAIRRADRIVIAPSNPIASIGPILAVKEIRETLASARVPRLAISPIVGGKSLKGPSDRMLAAAGFRIDAVGVAKAYHGLIDTLVIDRADVELRDEIETLGIRAFVTETVMRSAADRRRLAQDILQFSPP